MIKLVRTKHCQDGSSTDLPQMGCHAGDLSWDHPHTQQSHPMRLSPQVEDSVPNPPNIHALRGIVHVVAHNQLLGEIQGEAGRDDRMGVSMRFVPHRWNVNIRTPVQLWQLHAGRTMGPRGPRSRHQSTRQDKTPCGSHHCDNWGRIDRSCQHHECKVAKHGMNWTWNSPRD
jgi:hypothetical protein